MRVVFHHRTGPLAGIAQIMSTVDHCMKELCLTEMPVEFPNAAFPPDLTHAATYALLKATPRALYYTEVLAPAAGLSTFNPAQT